MIYWANVSHTIEGGSSAVVIDLIIERNADSRIHTI